MPQFALGNREPLDGFTSKYLSLLQNPWVTPECLAASQKEGFDKQMCFDVSTKMKYTKTPVFTAMNRFDAMLIKDLGLCPMCRRDARAHSTAGEFIRLYGT